MSAGTVSEHLCVFEAVVATIGKTPSGTWKAVVRKRGWPTTIKTFRTKRDASDWARRTEDEMVRGVFIDRAASERMLMRSAMERYLVEAGLGDQEVAAISGHRSMQMLRRYTHLRAEDLVHRFDQLGVR